MLFLFFLLFIHFHTISDRIVKCSAFAGGMKSARRNSSSCFVASVQFIRIADRPDDITMHIAQ